MSRGLNSGRFQHLVFPKLERLRTAVNLAPREAIAFQVEEPPCSWLPEEKDFVGWLLAQGGVNADHYRSETLQRRLAACLRAVRTPSVCQAKRYLQRFPSRVPTAINALLVGVTSFFRDPTVFAQLRNELGRDFPTVKRGARVWSAGCSDGAELYSVAMLLAEMGALDSSYLVGTDCRRDAVAAAREGNYNDAVVQSIPDNLRTRYTERHATCHRMVPLLRAQTQWRISNIVSEPEPGAWDLILCRNTALYLRAEFVVPLWSKLENSLRPGGILVLGRAERPTGAHRLRAIGPCIYRRV